MEKSLIDFASDSEALLPSTAVVSGSGSRTVLLKMGVHGLVLSDRIVVSSSSASVAPVPLPESLVDVLGHTVRIFQHRFGRLEVAAPLVDQHIVHISSTNATHVDEGKDDDDESEDEESKDQSTLSKSLTSLHFAADHVTKINPLGVNLRDSHLVCLLPVSMSRVQARYIVTARRCAGGRTLTEPMLDGVQWILRWMLLERVTSILSKVSMPIILLLLALLADGLISGNAVCYVTLTTCAPWLLLNLAKWATRSSFFLLHGCIMPADSKYHLLYYWFGFLEFPNDWQHWKTVSWTTIEVAQAHYLMHACIISALFLIAPWILPFYAQSLAGALALVSAIVSLFLAVASYAGFWDGRYTVEQRVVIPYIGFLAFGSFCVFTFMFLLALGVIPVDQIYWLILPLLAEWVCITISLGTILRSRLASFSPAIQPDQVTIDLLIWMLSFWVPVALKLLISNAFHLVPWWVLSVPACSHFAFYIWLFWSPLLDTPPFLSDIRLSDIPTVWKGTDLPLTSLRSLWKLGKDMHPRWSALRGALRRPVTPSLENIC